MQRGGTPQGIVFVLHSRIAEVSAVCLSFPVQTGRGQAVSLRIVGERFAVIPVRMLRRLPVRRPEGAAQHVAVPICFLLHRGIAAVRPHWLPLRITVLDAHCMAVLIVRPFQHRVAAAVAHRAAVQAKIALRFDRIVPVVGACERRIAPIGHRLIALRIQVFDSFNAVFAVIEPADTRITIICRAGSALQIKIAFRRRQIPCAVGPRPGSIASGAGRLGAFRVQIPFLCHAIPLVIRTAADRIALRVQDRLLV